MRNGRVDLIKVVINPRKNIREKGNINFVVGSTSMTRSLLGYFVEALLSRTL